MAMSSELGRILAGQPEHHLLDSLIDHGDTISLRDIPIVIQHLTELRDLIGPDEEPEAPERPETPEREPMIFQMDLSPRRKRHGEQELASTSEHGAFASSVDFGAGIELAIHTGTEISEEKQWYLQQIADKPKQALPVRRVFPTDLAVCSWVVLTIDDLSNLSKCTNALRTVLEPIIWAMPSA